MDHLLKYLEKHFNESDLSTSEFRLSAEYYLRFELGDPHKNGTIERVNQSVKRAVTIFEEIFDLLFLLHRNETTLGLSWYGQRDETRSEISQWCSEGVNQG